MCCKLYASILVALFVVDLGPVFAADHLRTRDVLRPGTSPQAAGPVANAETQGEAFFAPNRQHAALPGTSPRAPTPTTGENVQQPVANGPIRNDPDMPTEEGNLPVQEPLEEVRPSGPPVVTAPIRKNGGPTPGHFGRGQAEPSRNINPINNNIGQTPTNNVGGVREQPVQNTNPVFTGNGEVRDSDMPRNLPQPTATAATTPNQRGTGGPTAFGGAIWPDFFRRPNVPTSNTGASDVPMTIPTNGGGQAAPLQNPHAAGPQSVPMQNPQFGSGQGGQTSPTVDNLLDKLNTLTNLLGNNQGSGNGLGR